jgi:hypothetical protein
VDCRVWSLSEGTVDCRVWSLSPKRRPHAPIWDSELGQIIVARLVFGFTRAEVQHSFQTPWHCLPERSAPSRPTIQPKPPSPRGCHRCSLDTLGSRQAGEFEPGVRVTGLSPQLSLYIAMQRDCLPRSFDSDRRVRVTRYWSHD